MKGYPGPNQSHVGSANTLLRALDMKIRVPPHRVLDLNPKIAYLVSRGRAMTTHPWDYCSGSALFLPFSCRFSFYATPHQWPTLVSYFDWDFLYRASLACPSVRNYVLVVRRCHPPWEAACEQPGTWITISLLLRVSWGNGLYILLTYELLSSSLRGPNFTGSAPTSKSRPRSLSLTSSFVKPSFIKFGGQKSPQ